MNAPKFDRSADNVGNVLLLEHVNLRVPDPMLAHTFYVSALGLTRDPYVDFGVFGISVTWVNAGPTQFHLIKGDAQRLRGTIEFVVPDLATLATRLTRMHSLFNGTQMSCIDAGDHLIITCPWGNRIRCTESKPDDRLVLGIRALDLDVPVGTAAGIADFYQSALGAPATAANGRAEVRIGQSQRLYFSETTAHIPAYDGHHIAVYIADFSGPHAGLNERGHISEESDAHQYRFQALVDPDSGAVLSELEHEVRSLCHPMWGRSLVNRNAAEQVPNFRADREAFRP